MQQRLSRKLRWGRATLKNPWKGHLKAHSKDAESVCNDGWPITENPRQSAGFDFLSGTLAHLYSGAIDLKFPLARSHRIGRMKSQEKFSPFS